MDHNSRTERLMVLWYFIWTFVPTERNQLFRELAEVEREIKDRRWQHDAVIEELRNIADSVPEEGFFSPANHRMWERKVAWLRNSRDSLTSMYDLRDSLRLKLKRPRRCLRWPRCS